jgi:hypothetical protein
MPNDSMFTGAGFTLPKASRALFGRISVAQLVVSHDALSAARRGR